VKAALLLRRRIVAPSRAPYAAWDTRRVEHDAGEFALIARLARHLTGAGDDAAVVPFGERSLVLAVDAVVEGRHFRRDLSGLRDVGWKALAVNLSDLAAMGAVVPRAALVTLLRPAGCSDADVEELYEGLAEAARAFGVDLVGGDTTSAAGLALSVAAVGELEGEAVWRSGARAGDALVVVGALGAGSAGLAAAEPGHEPAPAHLAAHRRPWPLLAAGRVLAEAGATALIDVSDGLGQDLAHVCRASGVRARVDWTLLPVAAGVLSVAESVGRDPVRLVCGGGEDYALLAALPPDAARGAAAAAGQADDVPAAVVGEILAASEGSPLVALEGRGPVRDIAGLGWDHFRSQEQQ
jgi:thiamine-monophosphate kinase